MPECHPSGTTAAECLRQQRELADPLHDPFAQRTPKPWPADSWPTAMQLADWLEQCSRAERIQFSVQALANAQTIEQMTTTKASD